MERRQSEIAACNDDVEMVADRDDIDDEKLSAQKETNTEELSSTVNTDIADVGENKANIGGKMDALEICPPSHGGTGAENEAPEKDDGI